MFLFIRSVLSLLHFVRTQPNTDIPGATFNCHPLSQESLIIIPFEN